MTHGIMESGVRNNYEESNEVKSRSRNLIIRASIEGNKHIKNGSVKAKFLKYYDDIANQIVIEFEQGRKSLNQALSSIEEEAENLLEQSITISQKGAGFIAGLLQIKSGLIGISETRGVSIPYHGWMVAHGINNTIEGGVYFFTGDDNYIGPVKKLYEEYAKSKGCSPKYGDMAYNAIDLVFSAHGLASRSNVLKQHYSLLNKLSNSKKIILYRATAEDYLIGLQTLGPLALGVEGVADISAVQSIYNDIVSDDFECNLQ